MTSPSKTPKPFTVSCIKAAFSICSRCNTYLHSGFPYVVLFITPEKYPRVKIVPYLMESTTVPVAFKAMQERKAVALINLITEITKMHLSEVLNYQVT